MSILSKLSQGALLAVCCLFLVGCDPYRGNIPVTGTVTLDGDPYPNAQVRFVPKEGGRPAMGISDSTGAYKLVYIRETPGVPPGEYRVDITTMFVTTSDADNGREPPEKLPKKYNVTSELKATVDKEHAVHDFALTSK